MKRWQRWFVAVPALILCVAASQYAMRGRHPATGNLGYLGTELAGVEGVTTDPFSSGVRGTGVIGMTGVGTSYGVVAAIAEGTVGGLAGLYGFGPIGVRAESSTTGGTGVDGFSVNGFGVKGGTTGGTAIYGSVNSGGGGHAGYFTGRVHVDGPLDQNGLLTIQSGGIVAIGGNDFVHVESPNGIAISGSTNSGFGLAGYATSGTAVYGEDEDGGSGHAGYFSGAVTITGTLTNSGSSLRIDHPLDPENQFLTHSSVESSEMKTMYDGVVTLGADGSAVVELPQWFEALNKDFRYQLTCIGEHAPVYIAEKIHDNRFRIAGGYEAMEVSWMVTGIRNDRYAQAYPLAVETPKGPFEAGRYIHPELYGQPPAMRLAPSGRKEER